MEKWRDKYKELLFDKDVTYKETRDFAKNYLPQSLFRYRKFDEHWKSNVFNGELYFPPSTMLNDPFDCLTYVDEKYCNHVLELAINSMQDKFKTEDIVDYFVKNGSDKIKSDIESIREKIGVACFSDNYDSLLMWAHYTNSHQGICIEYNTHKIPQNYMLLPVAYQKDRYNATDDIISRNMNNILNPYFVKSIDWEYENEWRLVLTDDILSRVERKLDFRDIIVGIYLGLEIENKHSEEMQEIISWAKNNGIKVYKMKVHPRKYEMYPEEI